MRALLFLLVLVFSTPSQAKPAVLSWACVERGEPYCYADAQGRPAGLVVRLIEEIGRDLGIRVQTELLPWARAQAMVREGRIDLLVTLPTQERFAYAYFGREALVSLKAPRNCASTAHAAIACSSPASKGTADKICDTQVRSVNIFVVAKTFGSMLFFVVIGLALALQSFWPSADKAVMSGFVLVLLYMKGPLEHLIGTLPIVSRAQIAFRRIAELSEQFSSPEPHLLLSDQGNARRRCTAWN